jgi:hypothetical protein
MLIFLKEDNLVEEDTIVVTTTIEEDDKYYISYLGGSIEYNEFLKIDIYTDSVTNPINTIEEEVIYTQTKDKTSIILKDIYTILELKKGVYQLKITKPKNTVIYEIHITKYDESKEIRGIYEEDIKKEITEDLQPLNKYLIIRNWSASYGGFWWCVSLALHGCIIAEAYNLIPIIEYKGGLYSSNKIYEPKEIRDKDTWWSYFFNDPVLLNDETKQKVLNNTKLYPLVNLKPNRNRYTKRHQPYIFPEIPTDTTYEYTITSFYHCHRLFYKAFDRGLIDRYLVVKPYITKYIENWYNKNWYNKNSYSGHLTTKLIGIHYRGTDKFGWGTCNEGHPIHYKYEKVGAAIRNIMKEKNEKNYMIYCASDEAPFIEYMKQEFPGQILYHEDEYNIRATESTSGLNQNFSNISYDGSIQAYIKKTDGGDEEEKEKQMQAWKDIKNISIHFGKKESSNYMKGFYTLIDSKLFSRCDYIFKSRGNMSEYICRLNDKRAIIYDLNEIAA